VGSESQAAKFVSLLVGVLKSGRRVSATISCGIIWLEMQGQILYTPVPKKQLLININNCFSRPAILFPAPGSQPNIGKKIYEIIELIS